MKKLGLIVFLMMFVVSVFSIDTALAAGKVFSLTKAEVKAKSSTTSVDKFSYKDETITSNVSFHKVGDYVTYNLVIKNVTDKTYTISEITDNNKSSNVVYEYNKNKGTKVKKGESITLLLKALYKKGESDTSKRDKDLSVKLTINYIDGTGKSGKTALLVNPSTGDKIMLFGGVLLASLFIVLGILISKKKKLNKKVAAYLMILSLILPIGVSAASTIYSITFTSSYKLMDKVVVTVDIDGKKEKKIIDYNTKLSLEDPSVDGKRFIGWKTQDGKDFDLSKPIKEDTSIKAEFIESVALLDTGSVLNVKMKNLANNADDYTPDYDEFSINHIKMSNQLPSNYTIDEQKTISLTNSPEPVYIWWDEDSSTIYLYSKAKKIYLNSDSSHMFELMTELIDMPFLNYVDSSNVTTFERAFSYLWSIQDMNSLSSLNTSKVTNLSGAFMHNSASNFNPISSWDTSNVTDMNYMFCGTYITSTSFLSSWNVSKVENMSHMFVYTSYLTDLSGLSNWNTSSLLDMSYMFENARAISDLYPISGFNVSNVTDMSSTFASCIKITDLKPLSGWITNKLENLDGTFRSTGISSLDGLENWNISNITELVSTFSSCFNLTDVSGIMNWNVRNITSLYNLFGGCSKLDNVNILYNWNTSNVTNMAYLFSSCRNLTDASVLNSWSTSSLTNTSNMFSDAEKVSGRIRIQNNVTTYGGMFSNAATNSSGLYVDYGPGVTNISSLVATKSYNSKVYKGTQLPN